MSKWKGPRADDFAEKLLHEVIDAWEANGKGGRQVPVVEVERWLINDLAPAINKVRAYLNRAPYSEKVMSKKTWHPPTPCAGKEQYAFEDWAKQNNYDMYEHPLHYIFMDPKTNAARMGWNAAIKYVLSEFEKDKNIE